jgi:hypothetical protein
MNFDQRQDALNELQNITMDVNRMTIGDYPDNDAKNFSKLINKIFSVNPISPTDTGDIEKVLGRYPDMIEEFHNKKIGSISSNHELTSYKTKLYSILIKSYETELSKIIKQSMKNTNLSSQIQKATAAIARYKAQKYDSQYKKKLNDLYALLRGTSTKVKICYETRGKKTCHWKKRIYKLVR